MLIFIVFPRITEWLRLEGIFENDLVQPLWQSIATWHLLNFFCKRRLHSVSVHSLCQCLVTFT